MDMDLSASWEQGSPCLWDFGSWGFGEISQTHRGGDVSAFLVPWTRAGNTALEGVQGAPAEPGSALTPCMTWDLLKSLCEMGTTVPDPDPDPDPWWLHGPVSP